MLNYLCSVGILAEHESLVNDAAMLGFTKDSEKPLLACETCSRVFLYASDLRRHLVSHTGARPYECPVCAKTFGHTFSLTAHVRTHTPAPPQCQQAPCNCPACIPFGDVRTGKAIAVCNVASRGDGRKRYMCSTCGRQFAQPGSLRRHVRVHTGERPYMCASCGRRFASGSALRRHDAAAHGEPADRPLACHLCSRRFFQRGNLRKHLRTHTGERPYRCTHCRHAFAQSYALRVHVRMHTGERPYRCAYCDKTFSSSSSLGCHRKTHFRQMHWTDATSRSRESGDPK